MLLTLEVLMNDNKRLPHALYDTRHRIRQLAYFRMIHESNLVCRQSTYMDRRTFAILCHLLRTVAGPSSTEIVDVEEMVVMFLHVLAHDVKSCVIQRKFVLSNETVSQYFNLVLLVVLQLHDELIKKLVAVTNNCIGQLWKCFENCLEALDKTYIKVNLPAAVRLTFRTRKLDICDTKGNFVYVLADWEGFAVVSWILRDVLARPNGLMATSSCAPKHVWTKEEEDTLVKCLVELESTDGWKPDNGTF
ncbi:retrotransposon protein [Cucumis melo var. makuwa]|uniref:Retrotransposon protein n=1 Tax=Cucumis melo var. makuwa TaxID=1194695 RepID=A0A5A7UZN0_CUCMM|nr:retrotransposon protein [Cucumis melo var. makuwa]